MKELTIFNFKNNKVRTITDEAGEVWWVAKDVCNCLCLENNRRAVSSLDDDEKKGVTISDTLGGPQKMITINESGLYNLIFKSKKEEAKNFKRWITHEVLPQIRKTGGYIPTDEADSDIEILSRALLIAKKTMDQKDELLAQKEQKLIEAKPKLKEYDRFINAKQTFSITDACKTVGLRPRKTMEVLKLRGYLTGRTTATALSINKGYMKIITTTNELGFAFPQTRVTTRGIAFLGRNKDNFNKLIEKIALEKKEIFSIFKK